MPFGTGTVVTNIGKAILTDRVRTTPATYTAAPKFAAMGTGANTAARTAALTDTALSAQVETRTSSTETLQTTTTTNDTYQAQATISATAARAVDEAGLFDAASAGNLFTSATFPVVNLASGDSIQFTWRVQLT